MKKLFVLLLSLISVLTFSQEKKKTPKSKDLDKEVNLSLDSLSKVYNKKVLVVKTFVENDTLKRYIGYIKNDELFHELIEVKRVK
jgi:hypothetical protein